MKLGLRGRRIEEGMFCKESGEKRVNLGRRGLGR